MNDVALSLKRLDALLQAFEAERGPLGAAAIAERIGAPRSSTAALLRALTDLGLMSVDRPRGGYLPSARLGALCGWILEEWMPAPDVLARIAAAHGETGETAVIWAPSGLFMEVIHVLPASAPIGLNLARGARYPMAANAVTIAHLSGLPDGRRAGLIARIAASTATEPGAGQEALSAAATRAAAVGFAEAYGAFDPETAALAAPLARVGSARDLVLAFGGPIARVRAKRGLLVRALRQAIG